MNDAALREEENAYNIPRSPGEHATMKKALIFLLFLLLFLGACGFVLSLKAPPSPIPPTATPPAILPTKLPPSPTALSSPTPEPPDTGWLPVVSGMDVRSLPVTTSMGIERVNVIRLVPESFRLRIHYTPGSARPLRAWAMETGSLLTINAGYFSETYEVVGLTIVEGRPYGFVYADFAGMFTITSNGEVDVRWLRERPYSHNETLVAGVQSFPVLVKPGGVMGFPADADDGTPARRTVVALDRNRRILFLLAPRGYFSLHELAVWLVTSDFDVDIALNLDGGNSSGLWLDEGPHPIQVDSYTPIPAVISVSQH